jgi:hypothetical protein
VVHLNHLQRTFGLYRASLDLKTPFPVAPVTLEGKEGAIAGLDLSDPPLDG